MTSYIDAPSPNFDARRAPPDMLVLHYTGMRTAEEAVARLRDPLKLKQLQKGLAQLSEEGATQFFRPLMSNDLILGAVGVLQFEVVRAVGPTVAATVTTGQSLPQTSRLGPNHSSSLATTGCSARAGSAGSSGDSSVNRPDSLQ